MGVEDNIGLFEELVKVINGRDWTRFRELHAESILDHSPVNPEPVKGVEAHLESIQNFFTAFPDAKIEMTRAFGQGDWVVTELTFSGTHTGPLAGLGAEPVPPTNRAIRIDVCGVNKVEGGKVTEEHNYYDLLGMMNQLGLLPEGN